MAITWDTPVTVLPGVGPKRAALLKKLEIVTLWDLLRHYPRGYEDWGHPLAIADAPLGIPCCVGGTVVTLPQEHRVRAGMTLYRFTVSDGESRLTVTLFNNRFEAAKIHLKDRLLLYGTVGGDFLRREMASPAIEPADIESVLRPIYPLTAGLSRRMLQTTVEAGLAAAEPLLGEDPLPAPLRREKGLCSRREALRNIHIPVDEAALAAARQRLIFEELFLLQTGLLRLKSRARGRAGVTVTGEDVLPRYRALLPFALTGAQTRAIEACTADMRRGVPMNRLLQGDVGSGKTAVAAGVAWTLIQSGGQAALMAPTEILAEQHYQSLQKLLAPAGVFVGLLTGSTPKKEREAVLSGLQSGTLSLVVGTHALFSPDVVFARLGLVITDEQHRFGVAQRAALAAKGQEPHLLVMSATPIPRTLALMIYGDLDVSVLDELPPGRQPIETYAVGSDKRERAYRYVEKHLREGRQAYVVCPLVEEDEGSSLCSAEAFAASLQSGALRGYRVGLLHGRLKSAEKEEVMGAFSAGKLDVLVATTVIEVGVDVPNAVIIVIENADRFGLAQLHQLRGRVGRGRYRSTCILISDAQNDEAVRRMQVMCETTDGFRIADEDLKLRGPGDFFGHRQHGLPSLKIADLAGDMTMLMQAQACARALLEADPALLQPEHGLLRQETERLFTHVGENGLN